MTEKEDAISVSIDLLGRTTYERRASNLMQLKKYTPQSIVQSTNTKETDHHR